MFIQGWFRVYLGFVQALFGLVQGCFRVIQFRVGLGFIEEGYVGLVHGWFRVIWCDLGLFMVIQGWFMVGLMSVEGWIEVHVGIHNVCI